MSKYIPVILLIFSYQCALCQSLGELITVHCNDRQNSYVIFSEKVDIVDVSSNDVLVNVIDDNSISFKLANPFVKAFPINGIINMSNQTTYPLEIVRKDSLLANDRTQFIPSSQAITNEFGTVNQPQNVSKDQKKTNRGDFQIENAKKTMDLRDKVANVGQKKNKISSYLNLIAVDSRFVYVKTTINNKSSIDYKVDFYGLLVKTKNDIKVVGQNEDYIKPHYVFNEQDIIKAGGELKIVLVYELFTIKDNQELTFFMKELNGGRDLSFAIKSSVLLKSAYNLE